MRSVTTGFASLAFMGQLVYFGKINGITPKIGGNLFGLYLLMKMLVQLMPEYFAYYKKTFIRVKKIMAGWLIIGKALWQKNIKWQVLNKKKISD